MKNIFKSFLSGILIVALVIYPDTVIKSVTSAISTCLNVLLPSLFPFFVLSRIFIKSGGAVILGRLLNPIMHPIFGISGNGASAFILGIISGYPVGAKTAIDLHRQSALTNKEAENLICFCNNSGPLFIIGALGVGMLSSKKAGIFLYIVHVLSSITIGIILRFTLPADKKCGKTIITSQREENIFTSAVEDSMASVINVFAYVIFFAVMMDIAEATKIFAPINRAFESLGIIGVGNALICSVFEMTTGIKKLSAEDIALSVKLILSSFMLGWSGLSIHFQTKSVLGKADFRFLKYMTAKFTQGIIAAIYTFIGLKIINFDKSVFLSNTYVLPDFLTVPSYLTYAASVIGIMYIIIQLRSKRSSRYSERKQTKAKVYREP